MAGAADAILIASPEYAHEMPGSLKNALDWLVSSGELYGKPAAWLCASPSQERRAFVREALQRALEAEGASLVMSTTIAIQRPAFGAPHIDPGAAHVVVSALETLRRTCNGR
jgi:NAD(P)H-dependent FMN reductase